MLREHAVCDYGRKRRKARASRGGTHHPAAEASPLPQLNTLPLPRELAKYSPSFYGCLVSHEEGGYRVLVAGAQAPLREAAITHAGSAASST